MARYLFDYGAGAGNEEVTTDDLDKVLEIADGGASYTQQNIKVYEKDEEGEEELIAIRYWDGRPAFDEIEMNENPLKFGDWGYYGDWVFF